MRLAEECPAEWRRLGYREWRAILVASRSYYPAGFRGSGRREAGGEARRRHDRMGKIGTGSSSAPNLSN
jgi:hypothetical protein